MNSDADFYDQRAADIKAALDRGDDDTAARLIAHTVIEEGAEDGMKGLNAAADRRR